MPLDFLSTVDAPLVVRVLVGAVGILLLLQGARLYKAALLGSSFALGAIAATAGLIAAAPYVPALARPEIVIFGAVLCGAAIAGSAAMAHRVALLAVGGIAGVVLGAATGDLVGGAALLWAPVIGALLGAAIFPFVFRALLKFLTPAVGSISIAWAVQRPEQLWLIGAMWIAGTMFQLGLIRTSQHHDNDDG